MRRSRHASTPIPRDGAQSVRQGTELMFLEAYCCSRHTVWLGANANDLKQIARLEDDTANIVKPPELSPGGTYYWRVDAIHVDGTTVRGQTWSFRVEE